MSAYQTCPTCGTTTGLVTVTVRTPVGVYCAAMCDVCADHGRLPTAPSWREGCERVAAHAGHLGVNLDQMSDLIGEEER